MWLGINDLSQEGKWRTQRGQIQTYFNWAPGQPDNLDNENYSSMLLRNGLWNDMPSDPLFFVFCTYIIEGTDPGYASQDMQATTQEPECYNSNCTRAPAHIVIVISTIVTILSLS